MKRLQYTIRLDAGRLALVDGIVMDVERHLGLHVGMTHYVDVTHIPSGKKIAQFHTLGGALEFVHRVHPLLDWALTEPLITKELDLMLTRIRMFLLAEEQLPKVIK